MSDDAFADELKVAGLRDDWDKQDDEYYRLDTEWWQSFSVSGKGDHWTVTEMDHDNMSADGSEYTSYESWDDVYTSWIDAARAVEKRVG